MKIQIWVKDLEVAEKKENMGFDTGEQEYELNPLYFNKKKLSAFWCDGVNDIDIDTRSRDIAFYLDGYYFRTPYTEEKEEFFKRTIEENEQA